MIVYDARAGYVNKLNSRIKIWLKFSSPIQNDQAQSQI